MATSKQFLTYLLEQLSDLEEITHRAMMGEYIIYYRGKIAAYVCDETYRSGKNPYAAGSF